jgi:CxxC-x17-CxxC domain-containing protein
MEDKEMHKATCSDCGKECEVPFKPSGDKPVRCQDCFRKNKTQRSFGGNNNRRFGNNNNNRRFGNDRQREMHKTTCSDCGKNCEVPFKPSKDKPVRCKECFRAFKN